MVGNDNISELNISSIYHLHSIMTASHGKFITRHVSCWVENEGLMRVVISAGTT